MGYNFKPRTYRQLFNRFVFTIGDLDFFPAAIQYTLEHCGILRVVCSCGASISIDATCAEFRDIRSIDCRRCGSGISIEHLEDQPNGDRSRPSREARGMRFLPDKVE